MSLVAMLDGALAADLNKSEWRAFAALLRQTLGFNKLSDALTFGRLAQITGLRKDHAKAAVQGVVKAGLFTQEEHPNYEFLYTVAHAECLKMAQASKPDQEKKTGTPQPIEFIYPKEIDHETQQNLTPSLAKLRSADAQNVCDLLAIAIRTATIRTTPARLGFALIKAAQNGTLDKTALQPSPQQPAQTPSAKQHPDLEARFRDSFFTQVAALTGSTIEAVKAQHGCHV